jgi:hypothetical protein
MVPAVAKPASAPPPGCWSVPPFWKIDLIEKDMGVGGLEKVKTV